jgi:hypothetical protein
MTNDRETNSGFLSSSHAVVEALLDGEGVDPQALKDALADPAARDHFVDLLVLRDAVSSLGAPAVAAPAPRSTMATGARWLAAAAAVVLCVAAGYFAGQRVVTPVSAQTVEALVLAPAAPAAPEPTRVITLRPGVNWTETEEGR